MLTKCQKSGEAQPILKNETRLAIYGYSFNKGGKREKEL